MLLHQPIDTHIATTVAWRTDGFYFLYVIFTYKKKGVIIKMVVGCLSKFLFKRGSKMRKTLLAVAILAVLSCTSLSNDSSLTIRESRLPEAIMILPPPEEKDFTISPWGTPILKSPRMFNLPYIRMPGNFKAPPLRADASSYLGVMFS